MIKSATLRIALTILLAQCMFVSAAPADEMLASIRAKACALPQRIGSIEFAMTCVSREVDADGGETQYRYTMKNYQQGGRFRSETTIEDASDGSRKEVTSAYNGAHYQVFLGNSQTLSLADSSQLPNPYYVTNPILVPYIWLFDFGMTLKWSAVRDYETWRAKFENARYIGRKRKDGATLLIVEVPFLDSGDAPPAVCMVYFSRELGYFPVRSVAHRSDGSLLHEINVAQYASFNVDGELAVVPLVIHCTYFVGGNTITERYEISKESLRINHPIDEDFFTIAKTRARIINDVDAQRESLRANGAMVARNPSADIRDGQLIRRLVFVTAMLFAVAIGLFAWRRLNQAKTTKPS